MQHDPAYATRIAQQNAAWLNYKLNHSGRQGLISIGANGDTTYEIPVVFHVIHTGQAVGTNANPTNTFFQDVVTYMNQAFAASGAFSFWAAFPDSTHGGTHMPFRFVLAKSDPGCQPTTGITRNDGISLPGYAQYGLAFPGSTSGGASDMDVKTLNTWSQQRYVNIWIVTYIDGDNPSCGGSCGIGGYCMTGEGILDGIVLPTGGSLSDSLLSDPNMTTAGTWIQWAIVHEMGHYFGLWHTFEGSVSSTACPPNNDCNTDNDGVCDTDPIPQLGGSCPTGINPCTGTSYVPAVNNMMGYANCPDRFTPGQRERMVFMAKYYNASLLLSYVGVAPTPA
jgi:hypothetical protein